MEQCSVRPYEGEEAYIFISYCHKDKAAVYPIVERLDRDGARVWYDEGIDPGSEWPETIARHLDGSAACVAFVSENALNSHNCRREINYALLKEKPFLSVVLEPVALSPGMELQLSATQAIYKHTLPNDEAFFDRLCSASFLAPCFDAPAREGAGDSPRERETAPPDPGPPENSPEPPEDPPRDAAGSGTPGPDKKKGKKFLPALIASVCAAAVLIAGLAAAMGGKTPAPTPSRQPQSQNSAAPGSAPVPPDSAPPQQSPPAEYLLFNQDSEPVDIGQPDRPLDPGEVYAKLTYTPEMLRGNYKLTGGDEAMARYRSDMDYIEYRDYSAAYQQSRTRYLTAIPYAVEAGPNTLNVNTSYPDQAIRGTGGYQELDWMKLYLSTQDGERATLYCTYSVEGNRLKLTPVTEQSYDQETREKTYGPNTMNDYELEYEFAFSGIHLTLSRGGKSVTLTAGSVYREELYFRVDCGLAQDSPGIDAINWFDFRWKEGDPGFNLFLAFFAGPDSYGYDSGRARRNENAGALSEDGLFTFTIPYGYSTGDRTYQFVYFYCEKDGLILTDGDSVYRYTAAR